MWFLGCEVIGRIRVVEMDENDERGDSRQIQFFVYGIKRDTLKVA